MEKILHSFIAKDDLNEPLILQGDRVYYTPFKDFKGDFKELNGKFLAIELNGEKSVRRVSFDDELQEWSEIMDGQPIPYTLETTNYTRQGGQKQIHELSLTEEIIQKSNIVLGVVDSLERQISSVSFESFQEDYNTAINSYYQKAKKWEEKGINAY